MAKNLRFTLFALLGAALIAAGVGFWQLPSRADTVGIFLPDNGEYVSLGKRIYLESCASCHGANLEGQTVDWKSPGPDGKLPAPPHDEKGHTWHHADQLLFNITKFGLAKAANLKNYESAMPAYEGVLSDKEIIAVFSFIKSTWPEGIRMRHDELNKTYKTKELK